MAIWAVFVLCNTYTGTIESVRRVRNLLTNLPQRKSGEKRW